MKILRINKLLKVVQKILFPWKNLSKKTRRRILFGSIFIILILSPIAIYTLTHLQKSEAAWFDTNWGFRQNVSVSNSGSDQTDFVLRTTLDTATLITAGKVQSNCNDIRVTDVNGKLLPYFVSLCNNSSTNIYFKVPTTIAGSSTFYVYYGNPSAANKETAGNNIFTYFNGVESGSASDFSTTQLSVTADGTAKEKGNFGVDWVAQGVTWDNLFQTFASSSNWTNQYLEFDAKADSGFTLYVDPRNSSDLRMNAWKTFAVTTSWSTFSQDLDTNTYAADIKSILYFTPNDNTNRNIYIDSFRIRKYDPSVTVNAPATEEAGPGPVAYWKFDEGTGTIANDSSSNKNNGTLTNSPTWQTNDQCISGKCLYFNGSTSYVTANNSGGKYDLSSYTWETWVKPTWTSGSNGYNPAVMALRNGTNTRMSMHIHDDYSTLDLWNGSTVQSFTYSFKQDNWYHIVLAYSSGTSAIYINGILINSVSYTQGGTTALPINIGSSTGAAEWLKGFIDDVKVYKYARTAAQVQSDFNSRGSAIAAANVLGASTANQNLSNGLVGYWKMDESSGAGSTLADSSGNGNTGTAVLWGGGNTATDSAHVAGKFGNSFSFDGGDDYVDVGNSITTSSLPGLTISAWIKRTAPASGGQDHIVSNWTNSYHFVLNGGKLELDLFNATGGQSPSLQGTTVIQNNTWYFLTATYDGSIMKVYVNGNLENSASFSGNVASGGSTTKIGAGGAYPGTWSNYLFNGVIDEVRIYKRGLSPAEVAQLYNFAPGPVAYWNFEEGSGGSVNDTSGNGNIGTWNGTGSHWTQGKYGKAGSFNGIDDFVNVPNSSFLNPNILTVSTWAKSNTSTWNDYGFLVSKRDVYIIHPNQGLTTVNFYINNGSWVSTTCTPSSPITNWHYYTLTWDGTNLRCYIDGILGSSSAPGGSINTSDTGPLNIGRDDGLSRYLNGKMDDVKIYNYARTSGQIVSDMNGGHPAGGSPVGSQVGYWKFDEGYGTTANNSGNGGAVLNGTLTSGATWINDGKFGKALSFASGANVNVPANSGLNQILTNNKFTYSAWIYPKSNAVATDIMGFSGYSPHWGYSFRLNNNGNLILTFQDSAGTWYSLNSTKFNIPLNSWSYVAVTYDASAGNAIFYYNGTSQTIASSTVVDNTGTQFRINITGWVSLDGYIDEVKVYSYPLTADEVKLDMNHGATQVLGSMSDTSGLTGGQVASNSASAAYCIPGDTSTCSSPVGEWNFEEKSSTIANDSSGNGNTLTWSSTATNHYAQGKYGNSVNTSTDYLSTSSVVTSQTINVTEEAWVYWNGTNGAAQLVLYDGLSSTNGWGILISDGACGSGNKIGVLLGSVSCDTVSSSATLPTHTWTHVALTRNSTTWTLYVNGQALYTSITNPNIPGTGTFIGGDTTGAGRFNGRVDRARIFTYARTPAQVAYDYNRGGPVGYWKMDECQGTTANDSSGNGNTGTITIGGTGSQTSAGTCTTTSTAWGNGAVGKYNASLNFDGTDDYVNTSTPLNWTSTTSFSFGGWFNLNNTTTGYMLASSNTVGAGGLIASISKDGYVSGKISMIVGKNGTGQSHIESSVPYVTGTWEYYFAVYDGANNMYLYRNGVLVGSGPYTNGAATSSGSGFYMMYANNASNYVNGKVDDVRIYNYALTQTQIQQLYNQGAGVRYGPVTGSP